MTLVFVSFISICLISGCSWPVKKNASFVSVEVPPLAYSGRGAGASFALMGAMGPAGIAIGAAIDEGIAKDIRQALVDYGYDFKEVFCQKLQNSDPVRVCISDFSDVATEELVFDEIRLQGDSNITLTVRGRYIKYGEWLGFDVEESTKIESVVESPFPVEGIIRLIEAVQSKVIKGL